MTEGTSERSESVRGHLDVAASRTPGIQYVVVDSGHVVFEYDGGYWLPGASSSARAASRSRPTWSPTSCGPWVPRPRSCRLRSPTWLTTRPVVMANATGFDVAKAPDRADARFLG